MSEKRKPIVKVVELGDAIEQLQPTIDAIDALVKQLKPPNDFLIYPVLMASMLYEMSDGDTEAARDSFSQIGDLVIFSFMALRMQKRVEAATTEPANKGLH